MINKVNVDSINKKVEKIFDKFSSLVGSEHIANIGAMQIIYDILEKDSIKNVLELGGGIGTFSYLCLKEFDVAVDIYENNNFCIESLNNNLVEFQGRFSIIRDYDNFSSLPHKNYDLIICDGGPYNLIGSIIKNIDNVQVIFFEGRRLKLQLLFARAIRKKYYFKWTPLYYKNTKKCGYIFRCYKIDNKFKGSVIYYINLFNLYLEVLKNKRFAKYVFNLKK